MLVRNFVSPSKRIIFGDFKTIFNFCLLTNNIQVSSHLVSVNNSEMNSAVVAHNTTVAQPQLSVKSTPFQETTVVTTTAPPPQ